MQEAESLILGSHDEVPTSLDLLCRAPCPRCARLCSLDPTIHGVLAAIDVGRRHHQESHHHIHLPAHPLPVSQFAGTGMPAAWSVCVCSLKPERMGNAHDNEGNTPLR